MDNQSADMQLVGDVVGDLADLERMKELCILPYARLSATGDFPSPTCWDAGVRPGACTIAEEF
jgi:hypothetical protein